MAEYAYKDMNDRILFLCTYTQYLLMSASESRLPCDSEAWGKVSGNELQGTDWYRHCTYCGPLIPLWYLSICRT
jgi:hypothetical protein